MIDGAMVVGFSTLVFLMIRARLEARSARTELGRLRLMLVKYGEELVHGEMGYRRAPDGRIGVEAEARRLYDRNSALAPAPHSDEDFPSLQSHNFDADSCDACIVEVESNGQKILVPSARRGTQSGGLG